MRAIAPALLLLAGCGGIAANDRPTQHVGIRGLTFEMPLDWHRADTKLPDVTISTWSPDGDVNERRETVTVIRSERFPLLANQGRSQLERILANAQKALPHVRTSEVTPITTDQGLSGYRIDVDFVPPERTASYHRVHALVIDGSALVDVLYTARDPDEDLDAFETVLQSVRHGGG